ncbi:hypothetical protein D3C81_09830 [compost metagenome]
MALKGLNPVERENKVKSAANNIHIIGRVVTSDKEKIVGYVGMLQDRRKVFTVENIITAIKQNQVANMTLDGSGISCTSCSIERLFKYSDKGYLLGPNGFFILGKIVDSTPNSETRFKVTDANGKVVVLTESKIIELTKQSMVLTNSKCVERDNKTILSAIRGEFPLDEIKQENIGVAKKRDVKNIPSISKEEDLKYTNHKKYLKKALAFYTEQFLKLGYIHLTDTKTSETRVKRFKNEYAFKKYPELTTVSLRDEEIITFVVLLAVDSAQPRLNNYSRLINITKVRKFSNDLFTLLNNKCGDNHNIPNYVSSFNALLSKKVDDKNKKRVVSKRGTHYRAKIAEEVIQEYPIDGILNKLRKFFILKYTLDDANKTKRPVELISLGELDFSDVATFREFGYTVLDEEHGVYHKSSIYNQEFPLRSYKLILNSYNEYGNTLYDDIIDLVNSLGDLECVRRIIGLIEHNVTTDNEQDSISQLMIKSNFYGKEDIEAALYNSDDFNITVANAYFYSLIYCNNDLAQELNRIVHEVKGIKFYGLGKLHVFDDDDYLYHDSGFRFNDATKIIKKGLSWKGLNTISPTLKQSIQQGLGLSDDALDIMFSKMR